MLNVPPLRWLSMIPILLAVSGPVGEVPPKPIWISELTSWPRSKLLCWIRTLVIPPPPGICIPSICGSVAGLYGMKSCSQLYRIVTLFASIQIPFTALDDRAIAAHNTDAGAYKGAVLDSAVSASNKDATRLAIAYRYIVIRNF